MAAGTILLVDPARLGKYAVIGVDGRLLGSDMAGRLRAVVPAKVMSRAGRELGFVFSYHRPGLAEVYVVAADLDGTDPRALSGAVPALVFEPEQTLARSTTRWDADRVVVTSAAA